MKLEVFHSLIGVVLTRIQCELGSTKMKLTCSDGRKFVFYSFEASCGNDVKVWVEDIVGDINDLLNSPILEAEEISSEKKGDQTWTFYRFSTVKGTVTIRWLGESNGYYSEKVDLEYD